MLFAPTWTLEDDAALVAALRRGDPDAAERLVERYGDRVHTLAVRLTRSAAEAAATVEEALTLPCPIRKGCRRTRLPRSSVWTPLR